MSHYTLDSEDMECPYCGYINNAGGAYDPQYVPWTEENPPKESECDGCGKTFYIAADVSVSWEILSEEELE